MAKQFKFVVPEGDWDYDVNTKKFTHKELVFTVDTSKQARDTVKEYARDKVAFTLTFSF